jgi:peroxiredoxin
VISCLAPPALADEGQDLAQAAGQSLIGKAAPRLKLKTIDGRTIDLGRLYGHKAVYLKFWATWCVPCREQMQHLEHAYRTAGSDLEVIAVNTGFNDSLGRVRDYRRKLGLTVPMAMDDGRLAAALNLRVTPQHVVIGRDGKVVYVGHLADARLDQALRAARSTATAPYAQAGTDSLKATPHYGVGDRLPDLAPKTLDGGPFAIRDKAGARPTVLLFVSPWCESYLATSVPKAAKDCGAVREQAQALARDSKVRVLGVASGLWASLDDLTEYRKHYGITEPLTLDETGDLFRAFRVTSVPTVLVADAHGRIVRRLDGPAPGLAKQLADLTKP